MNETQTLLFICRGFFCAIHRHSFWSRAKSTNDFYVAGKGVNPIANGIATAADWMSAASFISMAGLIAFLGKDGSVYLMGWTGGYVLLALLLALFKKIWSIYGARFYRNSLLLKYCKTGCGDMSYFCFFYLYRWSNEGSRHSFLEIFRVDIDLGVIIGMIIVFFYAVMGGMKGITYTQVAQYCVIFLLT